MTSLDGTGGRVRALRVGFSADLGFAHPDLAVDGLVRRRLDEGSGEWAVELAGIAVRLARRWEIVSGTSRIDQASATARMRSSDAGLAQVGGWRRA